MAKEIETSSTSLKTALSLVSKRETGFLRPPRSDFSSGSQGSENDSGWFCDEGHLVHADVDGGLAWEMLIFGGMEMLGTC